MKNSNSQNPNFFAFYVVDEPEKKERAKFTWGGA